ncbi:MAG: NUDIX domain-containing protein [Candidatus Paceibacterota bacterium]|jgi:8-oxo-dGTP diphosphatase
METKEIKKKVGAGFGVMVLRGENVLLGKRHVDPKKAGSELHGEGTWTMPGGKLEFMESFEAGACRELQEETGLVIKEKDIRVISLTNDIVTDAHFVTVGMVCTILKGEPKVMEPDEITEWKWFPLSGLPKPLFPPSAKIVRNVMEGEFYKN